MEHGAISWIHLIGLDRVRLPSLGHLPLLGDMPEYMPPYVGNSLLVMGLVILLAFVGNRQLRKTRDAVVPDDRLTLRNVLELLVEAVLKLLSANMGERGKDFVLIIGGLVVFILFSNLSGVIPGFDPPTDSLNTTAACALTVFALTHYYGLREHGLRYLKHFAGPFWWLAPLMIPIEIIGHLARPLSLSLRLFGNIMGDHTVFLIFFGLMPFLIPIVVMVLGIFVGIVQTLVFVLLSMAYFSGAIEHMEE
ncbi:MAG: F0F1 ATP synthase subunit A [Deltaproteobacteria bacterium]|nr:F0F1 ATP synthase subunit A [Deltaproteobacteria bacterium]MBW2121200.1 F0F1 ATP synthase subunit A [Deltaproteobacteria bacterium]